jgi:hypothetical protein
MSSYTVRICELLEGLHGGVYYFIIEGNKLVHISRYGVTRMRSSKVACYDIDLNRLKGKTIIEVMSASISGYIDIWMYPAEDLTVDQSIRRKQILPITIINNYELTYLNEKEKLFLNEWNKHYKAMLNYIRKEVIEKGGRIISTLSIIIHIENDLKYPTSFLIPYSNNARFKSLSGLTKQIYQIWIIIRILREFTSINRTFIFKQSPYSPIEWIDNYSLWYEFDLNPHTMCNGMLWHTSSISPHLKRILSKAMELKNKGLTERLALRPDIVFTYAKDCNEFMQNPAIKLIIECKNTDYTYWEKDINRQIKPYVEIFEPEYMLIASLKPVPSYIKRDLQRYSIHVIDNVYPGGLGEQELIAYVKSALGYL